jgi:NAD(P)-dependent dehydrogenase (short-subunit alcohol dehydrogenase family)
MFELDDRVALVTGGAGLIGEAVCGALVEQGAHVAVVEPDEEHGREAADRLGPDATFYRADVTEEESVAALFEAVTADHERLDVLVNCAYPRNEAYGRPFEAVEYDDWRENVLDHLGGYYLTSRAAGFLMADQGRGGSIVNLGSIYGTRAPDFSVYEGLDMTSPVEYAAIKGGIINLTRYLASYLGREGVRANVVSPGGVFDDQPEPFVERYEARTLLGRMAEPDDVAGAVAYLASDAAAYVTGQNLVVDGGWTAT